LRAFPIGSTGNLACVPPNFNGWAKINAKLVKISIFCEKVFGFGGNYRIFLIYLRKNFFCDTPPLLAKNFWEKYAVKSPPPRSPRIFGRNMQLILSSVKTFPIYL
jgi:hypothetical protein